MSVIQNTLPQKSLEKLKCHLCQKYLSIPPITLNNGKYTCGRCPSQGHKITIYEELGKFVLFPCSYENCKLQISLSQALQHEKDCPHRTIVCPFINCNVNCEVNEIISHYSLDHNSNVYNVEFTVSRNFRNLPLQHFIKYKNVYLLIHNSIPYIVMIYGNCIPDQTKKTISAYQFSFGVFYVKKKEKDVYYDASVLTRCADGSLTQYVWKNQQIQLYNDRNHCLKCIEGTCRLPFHVNKKNFLLSKLDSLFNHGDMNVSFTVKIQVSKVLEQQVNPGHNFERQAGSHKNDFTSHLECSACKDYMCPPIYICAHGHSICMNCQPRLSLCKICKSKIDKTRNYQLEQIANTHKIPCRNIIKGCNFTGIVKRTKQHLLDCKYNYV